MCLAFAAVIPPHSGDLFALSPEVSAQALVGGKPVLVERETDRPKLLDFYRANNFKSWNIRHSAISTPNPFSGEKSGPLTNF